MNYTKRKLYERLHVSSSDLHGAKQYATHLLKKGWHSAPWERRGSIYMQQSAFTTALVVSYARPFKQSRGWPPLPKEFWSYDGADTQLHAHLIELRDQVFAHSDSLRYEVKPIRMGTLLTDIESAPFLCLSKEECTQVVDMVDSVRSRLEPTLSSLRNELADGNES